jgi:hypothetical protein
MKVKKSGGGTSELGGKSRRQTLILHGHIKNRIRANGERLAKNKGWLAAGLGPWSLGPSLELPAPGLGPGPGQLWARAQAPGAGSGRYHRPESL